MSTFPKTIALLLFKLALNAFFKIMSEKITMGSDGLLVVPDKPIIHFIEGDGIGPDIWKASVRVFDAAVEKAYEGKRKIEWMEVLAGEKAFNHTG